MLSLTPPSPLISKSFCFCLQTTFLTSSATPLIQPWPVEDVKQQNEKRSCLRFLIEGVGSEIILFKKKIKMFSSMG